MNTMHTIRCTFSFRIVPEKKQILFEGNTGSIDGSPSDVEVEAAGVATKHMMEALREICTLMEYRTDYILVKRDGLNNERNKRA